MTAAMYSPVTADRARRERTWSTPARLRTASVVLAAGAVAAGIVGGGAVLARQHATNRAITTAQPLVGYAVTLDVSLADANTTIAGGFLGAPPVPTEIHDQYTKELATASSALTAAAQHVGGDARAAGYLAILSTGLPDYTATVATAEADYRQGFPVATAYLSEANYLMRTELLPTAGQLDGVEQSQLARDDSTATRIALVAVALGLLATVLVLALWSQVQVGRRFRRLINPGLVVTTLLVLIVAGWTVAATTSASRSVTAAENKGTAPLAALTQARIDAQQARADDELNLVTRNSDASFEADFKKMAVLLSPLFNATHPGWTAAEANDLAAASRGWNPYAQMVTKRFGGDQSLAGSKGQSIAAQDARNVDGALGQGVSDSEAAFDTNARAASSDLGGLALVGLILMILAGVAAVAGLQPRIREYR